MTVTHLHKLRKDIMAGDANALFELQKLATTGISYAQYLLGEMYYLGEGVEENYEEATKWLCLATDAGSPEAMITLAYFIDPNCIFANSSLEVKRVIKSLKLSENLRKTAFDIFVERAKNGDIYVAKWLESCYQMGWGIEPDIEKAQEWNRKNLPEPYPV